MDQRCVDDSDCLDNFWCNAGTCMEANTSVHCGDGDDGWEACGNYERCAGSVKGCTFCTSDEFCGTSCTACAGGEGCFNHGTTTECRPDCVNGNTCTASATESCIRNLCVEPVCNGSLAGTTCANSPTALGETCATAVIIGRTTARTGYSRLVNQGAAADDNNCDSGSGNCRDSFFKIFLVEGETLTVTVDPSDNSNPTIRITEPGASCGSACTDEISCVNNGGDFATETLTYVARASGYHTIKADTVDCDNENFTLAVNLTCGKTGCSCP